MRVNHAGLGVQIKPPKAHLDAGILFVDPLSVAVVPSATRDALTGAVLGGAQPVRENLYDQILKASCKFSTFITVTDILVGSITGSGSFALELGGVQATTSELKLSHNLLTVAPFTVTLKFDGADGATQGAGVGAGVDEPTVSVASFDAAL